MDWPVVPSTPSWVPAATFWPCLTLRLAMWAYLLVTPPECLTSTTLP